MGWLDPIKKVVKGADDLLGGAAGSTFGQIGADWWTQQSQSKEAARARRWSSRMSGSAHQRQVRDLRLAGLNPMLSAGLGGASTPGASMAAQHPMRNPVEAGIQAAQGVASAKLTAENAKVASLEAKHKNAFYRMIERGPGGAEIAAFNAMFPGNKAGQTAAAINLGVGKAKEDNWLSNTGKQVKKWWNQFDNYMSDAQGFDKPGRRYGKAKRAGTLKDMARMRRPSFEKNEPWVDALERQWRRENVPGFNINYKRR